MHVGRLLRTARKAKGLTQDEVARMLGLSRQAVGKIERRTSIHLDRLKSFAEALDLSLAQLGIEETIAPRSRRYVFLALSGYIREDGRMVPGRGRAPELVPLIEGFRPEDTLAYRVETNDLAPRLRHGDTILVAQDAVASPRDHVGELCAFTLGDGTELVRELHMGPHAGTWRLLTYRGAELVTADVTQVRPVDAIVSPAGLARLKARAAEGSQSGNNHDA
jgi:transcriptional regulator with XRE-family HTH domain